MRSALFCLFLAIGSWGPVAASTSPSSRLAYPQAQIPVSHRVDVVVIGGTAGAVEAAVAAAEQGASVFLAAPRTYLGDDICGQLHAALEADEVPFDALSHDVFWAAAPQMDVAGTQLDFSYTTDRAPWSAGRDRSQALADGKWADSRSDGVQFDGDVTMSIDLHDVRAVRKIDILYYQRPGDCRLDRVTVSASEDGRSWRPCGELENRAPGTFMSQAQPLTAPVPGATRFLRLEFAKAKDADRLLLGEVVIEGSGPRDPAKLARAGAAAPLPSPNEVKHTLDQALIKAGVAYLFSSLPVDLLVDAAGRPAGVVLVNASGRQAVVAKTIIDATERATVTRWTAAQFSPYPAGPKRFFRTIVGGPEVANEHVRLISRPPFRTVNDSSGARLPVREYELTAPVAADSYAAIAQVEQQARDWTWVPGAVRSAERLFTVPPDSIRGRRPVAGAWAGADQIPLGALQPVGAEGVYVLGGCADLSREAAATLLRPLNLMQVGVRVGRAAAAEAARRPAPAAVQARGDTEPVEAGAEVRFPAAEGNFRAGPDTVPARSGSLPVLGTYDVIVVGGGTGGAPAAIAAGRSGAKTLVVESLDALGGVGTAGMVSLYYNGNPVGFSEELDAAVARMGGTLPSKGASLEWVPNTKAEWYRQELRRRHVDIWFSTLAIGAVVRDGVVRGVTVATPFGPAAVLGKVIIDSTGNAAVAASAGAHCTYTGAAEIAVQGTGLPPLFVEPRYMNTDYTYVDESDVLDIWRAFILAREKFQTAYDTGQLIDSRERRRIVGDVELKATDAVLGRTWPDVVTISRSDFDSHGYTVDPLFLLRQPDRTKYEVEVPFRALLPRELDGIIVTGLGVSVQRDALPLIRMQRDIQNEGYAAGLAAAMVSAKPGSSVRELDIAALQRELVAERILPAGAVGQHDSMPLSPERIAEAVRRVTHNYSDLAVILSDLDTARPLLRAAFRAASSASDRLTYAHILGMLGDPTGAETLREEVARATWDRGWKFKGMGQYGASLSRLDSLIIALGRTRDPDAVPTIVARARELTPQSEFSHFRAIALALEAIRAPAAAKPLADMLAMPGMTGYAVCTIEASLKGAAPTRVDDTGRAHELAEIDLARALYRCGDYQGRGRAILESYVNDLRGHYARHARAVLAESN